jgi:hypothetical protein
VPKPPLPERVRDLLAKPNPSVITTVRPDGQPVSVATWYLGVSYPKRERRRVSAWIEVERWHGWGAVENTDVVHH